MKRIFFILYLLVILILIVPGQKKGNTLSELESSPRVMAILPTSANPFWNGVWAGIRQNIPYASFVLTEYDYEISDADTLLQLLDLAENVSPEGLILAPKAALSSSFYQKLQALRDQGVKIVVLDTDIEEDYYDAFLGIDNTAAGKTLGQYLVSNLKPGENVLEIYSKSLLNETTQDRLDAFHDVMAQAGLLSWIRTLETVTEYPQGLEDILGALENTKNLRYLVTVGPTYTLYAANALTLADLSPEVTVLGFGETQKAQEYVEQGEIEVLFMQANTQLGQRSVQIMEQLLTDGETQKRYGIDVNLITKQNIS